MEHALTRDGREMPVKVLIALPSGRAQDTLKLAFESRDCQVIVCTNEVDAQTIALAIDFDAIFMTSRHAGGTGENTLTGLGYKGVCSPMLLVAGSTISALEAQPWRAEDMYASRDLETLANALVANATIRERRLIASPELTHRIIQIMSQVLRPLTHNFMNTMVVIEHAVLTNSSERKAVMARRIAPMAIATARLYIREINWAVHAMDWDARPVRLLKASQLIEELRPLMPPSEADETAPWSLTVAKGCCDWTLPSVLWLAILSPLISNSMEALEDMERDPRIDIAINGGGKAPIVQIIVSDNGPGWTHAASPSGHISADVESTKGPGRGFGLAVVKRLVETMGGHLQLRNQSHGSGAIVEIRLDTKNAFTFE